MLTNHRFQLKFQKIFLLLILFSLTTMPVFVFATEEPSSGVAIEHWQLDNGARVYFVAAPELPMIDIRVVFDAGSAHESTGGVALLANSLLNEGADDLDSLAIAKRFEDMGARYSSNSHRDMAIVSLRSLAEKQYLDPVLETFSLIIREPTYPKDSLERERKRLFIALQAQQESLENIAENALPISQWTDTGAQRE